MTQNTRMEALSPEEMAVKAERAGIRKASAPAVDLFLLAILAGVYIGLGAVFATTVAAGAAGVLSYGVTKLLTGLVFCLGLILVVVGGAELFTGNSLIAIALASGKISLTGLLRNWGIVYLGNFIGSVGLAAIMFLTGQYLFAGGLVGQTALSIANGKLGFDVVQAIALGVMCNILVCLAVWLTFSARTTVGKISAILFPITAFVAAGFEHSVANMYFIPIGLFIKDLDPSFASQAAFALNLHFDELTWGHFLLNNLLPVTIGNIIGGSVFVGLLYWMIYLRKRP